MKNPECASNTASAILGVGMAEVARREGLTPTMGQSPFAIARGLLFERALFRDEAQRLREALARAEIEPPSGFRDLRLRHAGGPIPDLDAARAETEELLKAAASGASVAGIIAGAAFKLPGRPPMLPEAMLALDVLLIFKGAPRALMVGEVKTYPDRGGYTDRGELATARAQAGVYVLALKEFAAANALADQFRVEERGFLVLSRPGSNFPIVRAGEDLKYQAERARRGLERLRDRAAELGRVVDAGADRVAIITKADCHYSPACVSFCDRAQGCFAKAMSAGDAAALGEDVARFAGGLPLKRVTALMAGAPPASEAEASLALKLADALGEASR